MTSPLNVWIKAFSGNSAGFHYNLPKTGFYLFSFLRLRLKRSMNRALIT